MPKYNMAVIMCCSYKNTKNINYTTGLNGKCCGIVYSLLARENRKEENNIC